jgi:hypothetical protein
VRTAKALVGRIARDRVLIALALLLAAGFALRLWFVLVWSPALSGYSDSGIYFTGALKSLWSDPIRTVGYSMFLRVLHAITPHLLFVIVVQHGLGLLTAVIIFLAVARCGAPRWLGLLPAAMIALGGDQLFLEHAALSDALFIFLLVAALYCALRAAPHASRWGAEWVAPGSPSWAALAGLCVGLGVWDRGDGIVIAALIPLWLLFSAGRPSRRSLAVCAVALAAAVATIGVYAGWRKAASGMPGVLTSNNAYNLYARVAPWADCTKFTPPPGTRRLCEKARPAKRTIAAPGGEAYIYSPESPAYRLFGEPYYVSRIPHAMTRLMSFSEAAILGEPLEYLHAVWLDTRRLFDPNARSYSDDSADKLIGILLHGTFGTGRNELVEYWEPQLYPHEGRPHYGDVAPLERWERLTRIDGAWMGLLLALCLAVPWTLAGRRRRGLARRRARAPAAIERLGRARAGACLFASTALALLFFPILVKGYDYRFVIPAFGPLVAASALSAWGLSVRVAELLRGRRRYTRSDLEREPHAPAMDALPGWEPLPVPAERLSQH